MRNREGDHMKLTMRLGRASYDIILSRGAQGRLGKLANLTNRRALVVTDDGVPAQYADAVLAQCVQGGAKLVLKAGEETEINGKGPDISAEALEELLHKLDALGEGDVLVLAGSIPASMPSDVYESILARLEGKKVLCAVDATRDLLVNVLKYRPFVIKPNNHELGEIFGRTLTTDEEIRECAAKLQEQGARNVLVSMAGDGAMLLDENGVCHRLAAHKGKVKNSVGAGDSMVAGFLAGYLDSGDYEQALRVGSAAGSATAFSDVLATRPEIEALLNKA